MTNNTESTTTTKATAATPGAQDAPKPATATKVARTSKGAPKGKKGARKPATTKAAKPAAKKTAKARRRPPAIRPRAPPACRASSPRRQIVLDLLRRKDGATMAEIAKATDWQNHSIRGFISGHVAKKMGLAVESTKTEQGERRYKIATK